MTTAMRHVYDVKLRELTKIPAVNAPNAPTMESYGKNDEDILGI
jgi:hypothetical protein